jgi:hypothetical protein
VPNPYLDKLRTVGAISRTSKPAVTEGRRHPETGRRWKRTEDDGSVVTEHDTKTDRVDATAKVATVHASLADLRERKEQASRGQ